ncbi:MAG: TonB-dependent receptor [Bacteroidales bacterium]|nr:TonB-dependent receptor [Bacteroidales bacterium]MCF8345159.1 TonB-dependent receptor [Bacteroidales bacterium]MCF8351095.1 TonB-dependent receptor [Bacteroidales bacterium]MCF8376807.1 TonB-dependent receptor [Bacteroidales bacterium]
MLKRVNILSVLLMCTLGVFSQGIQDSVFQLKTVQVKAEQLFDKEEAGMKQMRVDSVILLEKVNLSLSDVLSENTSVFIKEHGRGALASASFRGTAPSHTQVNWNGININNPMAGMVDFSLIPVYVIDDVQLKFGAASIAGQSGGLGGSVNIGNRIDWQSEPAFRYIQGIGSYSTFDEFLQFGFGNSKIRSRTRLYHNYSKNDYTFINRGIGNVDPNTGSIVNPLDTNHNAEFMRYGVLQEVYLKAASNHMFSAKYWGLYAERTIPRATSYEGPDNSNLNRQSDVDHRVVADWKHFREKSKWLLRSGFTSKDLTYTLKNKVAGLGEVAAVYSESRLNSSYNKVSYTLKPERSFTIKSSIDFNYHDVNTEDTVQRTGYAKERSELSFLLALQKSYAERLNLNLMLRQNWTDFEMQPFVPFFGFDYRLIKTENLILKGSIARNYHQPGLNDLYWQPGGNPALEAEEGMSYELGLEYRHRFGSHHLQTELTAFYSDINNWIIWVPSYRGYWEPRNIKRVLSRGVEVYANVKGRFGKLNYKVAANYAYTSSVNYGDPVVWGDESYGKQLVYIPLHSGNLMLNLAWKGFYLTWQHNSYSERFTTSSNDISRRDWLYPHFMNDLIIGKEFQLEKLTLAAEFKIYNLFDETYHSVLYRPMPGRNYMLMLMIKI